MPPRLPILASRATRKSQRPPAGRRRARRLRGSPRGHPLPAPGPRERFAAAGVGGGAVTGDPRSSRARLRLAGGRAGRRSARGARTGSRARRPRRRPHRHRVLPAQRRSDGGPAATPSAATGSAPAERRARLPVVGGGFSQCGQRGKRRGVERERRRSHV